MIEFAAIPAGATTASAVDRNRRDCLISGIEAGGRASFRCLYAFMAMRVLVYGRRGPATRVGTIARLIGPAMTSTPPSAGKGEETFHAHRQS